MIALCVSNRTVPTAAERSRGIKIGHPYPLTVGQTYDVFGISFVGEGAWLLTCDDEGEPGYFSAELFRVDAQPVPAGWHVSVFSREWTDGDLAEDEFVCRHTTRVEVGFAELADNEWFPDAILRESTSEHEAAARLSMNDEVAVAVAGTRLDADARSVVSAVRRAAVAVIASAVDGVVPIGDLDRHARDSGVAGDSLADFCAIVTRNLVDSGYVVVGDYRNGFTAWNGSGVACAARVLREYRGADDVDWAYSTWFALAD